MPDSNATPKGARLALVVLALAFAAGALMFVEVHEHPRPAVTPSEAAVAAPHAPDHPVAPRRR